MIHYNPPPHRLAFLSILVIVPFFLLSSCATCDCDEDSLESVKAYQPDDKYFKSALVSLHFVMETSPVAEADSLFNRLIQSYGLPVSAQGAIDGSYAGASPYDAYDYRHEVHLEIKDGRIVAVDYNEVHKDGIGKQEDEAYCEEMSVTGTTPAIAYPLMEERLLAAQDIMQVDGVSGASYSLRRFRYAVTVALMKAMLANEQSGNN